MKIENELLQLKNGLNAHRIEVVEIKKQIETIKSSGQQDYNHEIPILENAEKHDQAEDEKFSSTTCKFRIDVDPQTDVQVYINIIIYRFSSNLYKF